MKDSKVIKIIIISCIILSTIGVFSAWQKGWLLASVGSKSDTREREEASELALWKILPEVGGFTKEKTYLVLFQNNLEIRPSGGYIGNFAILKVENGKPISFEAHDTNIFDGFGAVYTESPEPMQKYLGVNNWQMRDGNWSPDFPTAAEQVEYFYHLQGGQEGFDGVIAINASVLPALLEITGPVSLEEYDVTFRAEDVLYQLEYEIEKGYYHRQIPDGERKNMFKALVNEIIDELAGRNFWEQVELKEFAMEQLDQKNILVYFKDQELQEVISSFGWDGRVDQDYEGNYLMLVEANLGGRKSNYYVDRTVDYLVDLTKPRPEVKVRIEFTHNGPQKDWFTEDYRCYFRLYVPKGSWLTEVRGVDNETEFLDELNKTVFGNWIVVPVNSSKVIEYTFLLPEGIRDEAAEYILVQKQPGVDQMPVQMTLIDENHDVFKLERVIVSDWEGAWEGAVSL